MPALLVLIQKEMGWGDLTLGAVIGAYGLCFGLGSLPSGYVIDRVGPRPLLQMCTLGLAIAAIGMALSPSLPWFAACAVAMGVASSSYHAAGPTMLASSPGDTLRIFAVHGICGNLGLALAPLGLGITGAVFGWRWTLVGLAVGALLLFWRVLGLPPTRLSRGHRESRPSRQGYALLLVVAASTGFVYRGLITFLPKLFAGLSVEMASLWPIEKLGWRGEGVLVGGLLTTTILLVGVTAIHVASRVVGSGRVSHYQMLVASLVLQVPFLLCMGQAEGTAALLLLAMAVSFTHFLGRPVIMDLVSQAMPMGSRGVAFGTYFLVLFGAGAAGAGVAGWGSEQLGLAASFGLFPVVLLPAMVALLYGGHRIRSISTSRSSPQ
jgi:MFS family permease